MVLPLAIVRRLVVLVTLSAAWQSGVAQALAPADLLTHIPEPVNGVIVDYHFPDPSRPQQLIGGAEVTLLVAVRNSHQAPVNVTYLSGSINAVKSFKVYVQNLTTINYRTVIAPGNEQSFEYKFVPDVRIPARDFSLALTLFYNADVEEGARAGASTFLNQTVEVVEAAKLIDTEAFSLVLTLLAFFLAILYGIYGAIKDQPWFKGMAKKGMSSVRTKQPTTAASASSDQSQWLKGTPFDPNKRDKGKKKKN